MNTLIDMAEGFCSCLARKLISSVLNDWFSIPGLSCYYDYYYLIYGIMITFSPNVGSIVLSGLVSANNNYYSV